MEACLLITIMGECQSRKTACCCKASKLIHTRPNIALSRGFPGGAGGYMDTHCSAISREKLPPQNAPKWLGTPQETLRQGNEEMTAPLGNQLNLENQVNDTEAWISEKLGPCCR